MKQVININFHGQVVPIEVSAFDLLKAYTESLNRHFANEEGKDEIINDIESRIGELFQERLKKGATCITDEDVNAIIASMGRPEDFDDVEESTSQKNNREKENTQTTEHSTTSTRARRLYRNEYGKLIGGVCSGIATYFRIDAIIVRTIFAIVSFAFGTGVIAYFILWFAVPSSTSDIIGGPRKKLFRDPDDKILGGVCSGIGSYLGIKEWIPRSLFLIPLLAPVLRLIHINIPDIINISIGGSFIIYVILWLVIPEAGTTAEKLEMKGEKVDLNSIKNSVVEEMKGVQHRAEKFGKDAKAFAEEKGSAISSEVNSTVKRSSKSLGDIILLLIKFFAYACIAVVLLIVIGLLFLFATVSIGVFPLKAFLLTDGLQTALAWGTLIFFVIVLVIGVITWIIRRLTKAKGSRKLLRLSFISLWFIGWACAIGLIATLHRDFKTENDMVEQEISLSNPMVNRLEFNGPDDILNKNNKKRWLTIKPFTDITDEDSVFVNNVHFRILKSTDSVFRVTIIKLANGSDRKSAETRASLIEYNPIQKDSIIQMPAGIAISPKNKFRNQHVIMNVYVPVGKKIKINQNIWDSNRGQVSFGFDENWDWNDQWGNEERDWTTDVDYIMTEKGLYTLDGIPAKDYHKHSSDEDEKISIDENGIEVKSKNNIIIIDSNGVKIQKNNPVNDSIKQKIDQLKKQAEEIKKQQEENNKKLQDSMQKLNQQLKVGYIPASIDKYLLQLYNPIGNI